MLDIKKNKDEFRNLKTRYDEIKSALNYDFLVDELSELKKESIEEGFWENKENAQKILKDIKNIEGQIDKWNGLEDSFEELSIFIDLSEEESDVGGDLEESILKVKDMLDEMELVNLLRFSEDKKDAIITIHAGAGGTDAQDWASMLYRMYSRWCETNRYSVSVLSFQDGDEAGVKEVSLEVKGLHAYGYLKSEIGIHRLVRISPFNSNAKRHTSFASVFVSPVLDGNIVVDVNDKDLKIDTYRASGAGGQHVNKTDSAVRIKHVPTGIVVQCQNQRSQLNNKNNAIKMLKSKLYQLEIDRMEEEKNKISSGKKTISWGSQIRSYVFHPYNMVKDHRTSCETSNLNNVMDGDLEMFIRAYLLYQMEINNDRK